MVAPNMQVNGSATNFSEFGFSGTQFANQGAVTLTLLCGLSGLSVIPIRVDNTGAIENTT